MTKIIECIEDNELIYQTTLTRAVWHNKLALSSVVDTISESIYVSKSGTDSGDGSYDYPFNNIKVALDAAVASPYNFVYIIISDGVYTMSDSYNISAYNKRIAIIANGDVEINMLQSVEWTANNGIITINSTNKPNFIYINGVKKQIASTKKATILNGKATDFAICPAGVTSRIIGETTYIAIPISAADATVLKGNDRYKNVWITHFKYWTSTKSLIQSITDDNYILIRPAGNANGDTPPFQANDKLVIENLSEPLELWGSRDVFSGGSFYYDDSHIYYKIADGETIQKVELAKKGILFNIYSPVSFVGVKFRGVGYNYFANGYNCIDSQGAYEIDGAIKCYGNDVSFLKCQFTDIDQSCIEFLNGSSNSYVDDCYFYKFGAASVKIGELNKKAVNLPDRITMRNCIVAYNGQWLQESCGIVLSFATNCHIDHNEVLLCSYSGITGGHVWTSVDSDPETNYSNCTISYNKIHHLVGGHLGDLGGIYNLGNAKCLSIIGNEIHHIYAPIGNTAIYLDNGSANVEIRDNKCWQTVWGAEINCLDNNINIVHNIFNCNNQCVTSQNDGQGYANIVIKDNIFIQKGTAMPIVNSDWKLSNNLWYDVNGGTITIPSSDFQGTPYFKDNNGDFEVTNTVNTSKIGWVDINTVNGSLRSTLWDKFINDCIMFESLYF